MNITPKQREALAKSMLLIGGVEKIREVVGALMTLIHLYPALHPEAVRIIRNCGILTPKKPVGRPKGDRKPAPKPVHKAPPEKSAEELRAIASAKVKAWRKKKAAEKKAAEKKAAQVAPAAPVHEDIEG